MEAIIDFETLSIDETNCAVGNMSILLFEPSNFVSDKPYSFETLRDVYFLKLDIVDQVKRFGYKIQTDTLDFWSKQPKEVRNKITTPSPDDLKVEEFCMLVLQSVEGIKIKRWWSRGNNFDPVILKRLMREANLSAEFDEAFKYNAMRDIRTFIDSKFDDPYLTSFVPYDDEEYWNEWFKPHDSRYDVVADLLRLQNIVRSERDL